MVHVSLNETKRNKKAVEDYENTLTVYPAVGLELPNKTGILHRVLN